MFPARSPRIRHRNELTERDWENAVQGLGKAVSTTPPPWHYCKRAAKQVAEMWQASFSSTVDLQVSILINAVIISFLPGNAFSRFLTNGFFRFFLIPFHVVLLVLSDIFHHHIT